MAMIVVDSETLRVATETLDLVVTKLLGSIDTNKRPPKLRNGAVDALLSSLEDVQSISKNLKVAMATSTPAEEAAAARPLTSGEEYERIMDKVRGTE